MLIIMNVDYFNFLFFTLFLFLFLSECQLSYGYDPYPYNPRMHTLGNHGLLGRLHAEIGPLFTKFVDKVVYGKDVRKHVIDSLGNKRILDIGCGTGFSTSASPGSVGIDTSVAMIEKARKQFPNKQFRVDHAEHWTFEDSFDITTMMFCFHEIPQYNRKKIIERCSRRTNEKIVVIDISPEYTPSKSMLMGEPYLPDYLENIRDDLCDFNEEVIIDKHVHSWLLNIKS